MNPTGRPAMKKALYAKDWEAAAEAAVWQEREGADFLVVNAGLPDIDEGEALPALVLAIQKVSPLRRGPPSGRTPPGPRRRRSRRPPGGAGPRWAGS